MICDANCSVVDIVARWPGSTHDETIFLNSLIFERFLKGEFNRNGRTSILLGDGAYRSETFLAIPIRNTQQSLTDAQTVNQRTHIATRNTIERFFGQWKKRFPCLWIGMRFRKLEIQNVDDHTAVLHNICKRHGDSTPPQLSPDRAAQYNASIELEREVQQQNNTQNARAVPYGIERITARH